MENDKGNKGGIEMKKQHWQQIIENHQGAIRVAIDLFYQYGARGPVPGDILAKRLQRKINQKEDFPFKYPKEVV